MIVVLVWRFARSWRTEDGQPALSFELFLNNMFSQSPLDLWCFFRLLGHTEQMWKLYVLQLYHHRVRGLLCAS